jgi:hypothetical protein
LKEELDSMLEFRPRLILPCLIAVLSFALAAPFGASAAADDPSPAAATPTLPPALVGGGAAAPAEDKDSGKDKDNSGAYVWSATRSGSSLRLRGSVPSDDDRRTVLGMVKAHFPDLEVEDHLKIASSVPNKEQWLGAVSFGLKQLAHLKQGSARLLGVGLKVEGEARTAADYADVKKALAGSLPTGLTIMSDNVRPPIADPFIFTADLGQGKLTLAGSVPSEEVRGRLRELSQQLFLRPTLDDRLQPASGAPKDWDSAVTAALRALSLLESGKIALSGLAVTIEGVAPDKGTAAAVSYQLKRDLPALFSSSESIRWKTADSSRSLGERFLARIKDNRNPDDPNGDDAARRLLPLLGSE